MHATITLCSPGCAAESERYFGLENFGNTCYANSVLQALYFCAPFRARVLEYAATNSPAKDADESLLTCLADLFVQARAALALHTCMCRGGHARAGDACSRLLASVTRWHVSVPRLNPTITDLLLTHVTSHIYSPFSRW